MAANRFSQFDIGKVSTPSFVIDEGLLEKNLRILHDVKKRTGAKILLALKAYSAFSTFLLMKKYLDGVCASSPNEARLGTEEFGKEVVVAAPAYTQEHMDELMKHSTCIIFNSFSQWKKYKAIVLKNGIEAGIRINPEYSEAPSELYNPCAPCSRLGITIKNFEGNSLDGISGLHFHALCQQNADALERVLKSAEVKFGKYFSRMKWVSFGGGHHITKEGYDIDLLCRLIKDFRKKYGVEVYLEPGEAIALNAGFLVASVVDIIDNGMKIAILDTSAETHMPDVLAMPYTPEIIGAKIASKMTADEKKNFPHVYRLGGLTCLAGDVIGDYAFPKKLSVGQKLIFTDMAIYSMVKTTTFNGVNLPSISVYSPKSRKIKVIREFGYADFKSRLS
ncbi:carboxynorspermidine decarboxylase [Candidatus Woesearchaeota archaeon]|nr:carboxynorspermidine decarboxylase [Candidatus Woesearchaeota archaeon]